MPVKKPHPANLRNPIRQPQLLADAFAAGAELPAALAGGELFAQPEQQPTPAEPAERRPAKELPGSVQQVPDVQTAVYFGL